MGTELSHIDESGRPKMVDVSHKRVTKRTARARAKVVFPADVAQTLRQAGFRSKKGSIFDVAIVAGTMAAKRTSESIPFCHPLQVEHCLLEIGMNDQDVVMIECEVSVRGKTGVEMEALYGASVAALTVYDMCKALSHKIRVESVELLSKSGGKS